MQSHGVRRILLVGALLALTPFSLPARAQYGQAPAGDTYDQSRDWSDDIPAHLSFVEGSVTLERDGRLEPAEANLALLAGDRLRTRGGRVEILFADGSSLALDEYSELDLLSESLVRLIDGRMRLSIARATAELDYRVDAPAASVWIRTAGEYRIEVRDSRAAEPEVDLAVLRGSAELVNEHGRTLVRAGTHAVATPNLAPSLPYVVNSAAWDDFDRWTDRQRAVRVGTVSARYLPTEISYYGGAFDHYGSWDYVAPYGYVWYPRVATGWRPYSQGRWSFAAHFGWFWVGIDRWSWPTHHYGRWGVSTAGWYWIPDRRWAPAWVSWGYAPGYVSWCPLGYDGRPVYGFRYANPWSAWTIVPARAFVPNVWVTQHIVIHNTIAPSVRTQFAERRTPPVGPAIAVARNIEPIRAPTARGFATPRNARTAPADTGGLRSGTGAAGSAAPRRSLDGVQAPGARDASRAAAQPGVNAPRAVPDRSRLAPGSRTDQRADQPAGQNPRAATPDTSNRRAVPRTSPGVQPPDDVSPVGRSAPSRSARPDTPPAWTPAPEAARPRTRVPTVEPPRSSAPTQYEPDRSRSRASERTAPPPPPQYEPDRARSRAPERTAPPPPTQYEPDRSRSRAPERTAPPPPTQGEPDRARSRAPERTAPPPPSSAGRPPAAAPPPSRGRGSDAPPPAPSRGGGGGDSRAVPRARGGGN